MARFSSFIYTERNTEVHRLGNSGITSHTMSHDLGIKIECYKFGSGKKDDPVVEKMFVSFTNGYSTHNRYPMCFMTVTNGKIEIDPRFMDMVNEYNEKLNK